MAVGVCAGCVWAEGQVALQVDRATGVKLRQGR